MSLSVCLNHTKDGRGELYWRNITHNLAAMADCAGLYKPMWHPSENGIFKAKDLIPFLEKGLKNLKNLDEEVIESKTPNNGWGTYENLVEFTQLYLDACKEFPDAYIHVSR